jgi:hypothetical protein
MWQPLTEDFTAANILCAPECSWSHSISSSISLGFLLRPLFAKCPPY